MNAFYISLLTMKSSIAFGTGYLRKMFCACVRILNIFFREIEAELKMAAARESWGENQG
jgi:hypothetical protein